MLVRFEIFLNTKLYCEEKEGIHVSFVGDKPKKQFKTIWLLQKVDVVKGNVQ